MGYKLRPNVTIGDTAVPSVAATGCGAVEILLRIEVRLAVRGHPNLEPEAIAWRDAAFGGTFAAGSATLSLPMSGSTSVEMIASYDDATQARLTVATSAFSATEITVKLVSTLYHNGGRLTRSTRFSPSHTLSPSHPLSHPLSLSHTRSLSHPRSPSRTLSPRLTPFSLTVPPSHTLLQQPPTLKPSLSHPHSAPSSPPRCSLCLCRQARGARPWLSHCAN